MNGAHDLGSMMGFGPISPEPGEPVFHETWEARLFALLLAVGGVGDWSIDEDRAACENMPPADYVRTSYYEHWLHGLTTLLATHKLATADEIATGKMTGRPKSVGKPTPADKIWAGITAKGSYQRSISRPARFRPGDIVRTRNINPTGHTRLPRYARAKTGAVVRVHGAHVFPDSNAARQGEDPQWLYTVRFTANELWGDGHPPGDTIHLELWEPYLEPA